MPGNQADSLRLQPSQRQFFQWHLREKRPIREVKEKMYELTIALHRASSDFNFIAEEKSWRYCSARWNSRARKGAWKVMRHQKGPGLLIPRELAHMPVWIEWGHDVGDWRQDNSNENRRSEVSMAGEDKHQELYPHYGDWDGESQHPKMTQVHNNLVSSHTYPVPSTGMFQEPHNSSLTERPHTAPYLSNSGGTAWLQQSHVPFASVHPPMLFPSEQTIITEHQPKYSSNFWYQDIPTAARAPTASMSLPNAAYANNNDRPAFTRDQELSCIVPYTQSTSGSASGSTFQGHAPQGPHGYQSGYVVQPSGYGLQYQRPFAQLSDAQSTESQGPPVKPQTPNQRKASNMVRQRGRAAKRHE